MLSELQITSTPAYFSITALTRGAARSPKGKRACLNLFSVHLHRSGVRGGGWRGHHQASTCRVPISIGRA